MTTAPQQAEKNRVISEALENEAKERRILRDRAKADARDVEMIDSLMATLPADVQIIVREAMWEDPVAS